MKTKRKNNYLYIWLASLLFVAVTIVLIIFFLKYTSSFGKNVIQKTYSSYYGMILPDRNSSFWKSVYDGAVAEAEKSGAYVELLGENLARDFERSELLEIAIAANMDGIILVADESEEMKNLIDKAAGCGIPVVTLYTDSPDSKRCSYIGISNYNLGKEYGNQLLKILTDRRLISRPVSITILINSYFQDQGQNILVSGIQETIEKLFREGTRNPQNTIDINLVRVDETNDFSVEETVRKLLLSGDEAPDVFICLNEMETTTVYQTIVDYNKVGEISILGYYNSEAISQAIKRNVIHSTITVDTEKMGRACVSALNEYRELGNTSQYFAADVTLIDSRNVDNYLTEGQK